MRFTETKLEGAYIIDVERIEDERGFFARSWCRDEFQARGLHAEFVQCSISYNRKRSTLRGLHYQVAPYEEVKLVRCTRGAVFDVLVDLRESSSTFGRWAAVELTAESHRMVYIPRGFAHGFLTLEDGTELTYQISDPYHPASARGIRWDDAAFDITWPVQGTLIISERDRTYADFLVSRKAAGNVR